MARRAGADERRRDAERTKRALLDAALVEFAEKGRAGARVDEIAARAGVNKQLISYYFGGKDGLYAAITDQWLEMEQAFDAERLPLDELAVRYAAATTDQPLRSRLFLREMLEGTTPHDARHFDEHGEPLPPEQTGDIADLLERQRAGEIAGDLDVGLLLVALQALASAPAIFSADARLFSGLEPSSPEFAERYQDLVRRIVRRLALPLPQD